MISVPQTTAGWIRYFGWNAGHLSRVDWEHRKKLTGEEWKTIAPSLRVFQLGESSDGKSLRRATTTFARASQDDHLEQAMAMFIDEETRHADWLGRFMDQQQIVRADRHWSDHIFRRIRRFGDLEVCLTVLLTAELVAKIYYHALYRATTCDLLQQICRQLLRDEVLHVYFHTQLLRKMHKRRAVFWSATWKWLYRLFHKSTLLVVWMGHSGVLKKGGFSFKSYWKKSAKYCDQALVLISNRNCEIYNDFQGEMHVEPNVQQLFQ